MNILKLEFINTNSYHDIKCVYYLNLDNVNGVDFKVIENQLHCTVTVGNTTLNNLTKESIEKLRFFFNFEAENNERLFAAYKEKIKVEMEIKDENIS